MWARLIAIPVAVAVVAAGVDARAEVVDRLVAVVQGETLLESEIRLDAELSAVDPSPVPFWRMPLAAGGAVDPEVQRSIDALLLREQASDVALYQPTREQVAARIAMLRDRLRADDADQRWERLFTAHGLDDVRLEGVIRRRMIVERFLLRNLQSNVEDVEAWTAEAAAMIAGLRTRPGTRIRMIAADPGTQ